MTWVWRSGVGNTRTGTLPLDHSDHAAIIVNMTTSTATRNITCNTCVRVHPDFLPYTIEESINMVMNHFGIALFPTQHYHHIMP